VEKLSETRGLSRIMPKYWNSNFYNNLTQKHFKDYKLSTQVAARDTLQLVLQTSRDRKLRLYSHGHHADDMWKLLINLSGVPDCKAWLIPTKW
jgi:hypothetical protein